MYAVENISPADYAQLKNSPNPPVLIDVREPWEFAYARMEGAQLRRLADIHEWVDTLDKSAAYVLVCHHGVRSEMACQVLARLGFQRVLNLQGGIDAWSREVEPSMPRY